MFLLCCYNTSNQIKYFKMKTSRENHGRLKMWEKVLYSSNFHIRNIFIDYFNKWNFQPIRFFPHHTPTLGPTKVMIMFDALVTH